METIQKFKSTSKIQKNQPEIINQSENIKKLYTQNDEYPDTKQKGSKKPMQKTQAKLKLEITERNTAKIEIKQEIQREINECLINQRTIENATNRFNESCNHHLINGKIIHDMDPELFRQVIGNFDKLLMNILENE